MAEQATAADLRRIAARIQEDLAANQELRATARGLARSNMRRAGVLPDYTPAALLENLDEQLSALGFGLLQSGMDAREARRTLPDAEALLSDETLDRAFEVAGECFEASVRNGGPQEEGRGFLQILAGAAYHLGRFSARAFSVLQKSDGSAGQQETRIEGVLRCLILRDFERLDEVIHEAMSSPARGDEALLARLADDDDGLDESGLMHLAMQENYFRSVACFVFALRTGETESRTHAEAGLGQGEFFCLQNGFVTDWWINRVTRHLLEDLWSHSLRQLLPREPGTKSEWNRLRSIFIAVLASRKLAEVELWPSQLGLASRLMDETDDLVASLPTSAGKTRIAELCILRCLASGKRAVFVTPLRSLSAQTERTLRRTFRPLGFDVSSLYGSAGASSGDVDSLGNRPLVVCTPEKLDFALRNDAELFDDVGLVVFDEGHMLGPTERGLRYEVLVQRLLRRPDQASRRVVCLSAMLPDGEQEDDFVAWLRSGAEGQPLKGSWRPTRQRFGSIRLDYRRSTYRYEVTVDDQESFVLDFVRPKTWFGPKGGQKHFPASGSELCLAAALRLAGDGHSVLIYCPLKKSVRALAKRFAALQKDKAVEGLQIDDNQLRKALHVGEEWLPDNHPVLTCLKAGIAVHHASLPRPFLREMDALLADGVLKITIASPTLAQGLNLSASCLLFQGFGRFNAKTRKFVPLPSDEVANVAGRAGRAFVDNDGQVLGVCMDREDEAHWARLRASIKARQLDSGLLQLIDSLVRRLWASVGGDWEVAAEYILNQRDFWADLPTKLEGDESWEGEVALLDTSLLSLLGELEADEGKLVVVLDDVLRDSLLMRRLARKTPRTNKLVLGLMNSRAAYIWRNTTAAQRKGYFFAGVGFTTGQALDAASAELNVLILEAEEALAAGDLQAATKALKGVGDLVFAIKPFVPDDLPDNWHELLAGWLAGEPMAVLSAINDSASDVVEGALVYRLTWAIEAIRVRSNANGEDLFGDDPLHCSAALETGSISPQVAILVQAGLASRTAAQLALDQFPGNFTDFNGMKEWLDQPLIAEQIDQPWPTPTTALIWRDFLAQLRGTSLARWRRVALKLQPDAHGFTASPGARGWLRPSPDPDVAEFLLPDMTSCGWVGFSFPANGPQWSRAEIDSDGAIIAHYVGPWPR